MGSMASFATSLMLSVRLVLGLEKTPSAKLMSAASTLSRWAASCFALVVILSAAMSTADPPMVAEREPPVPSPRKTWSVSPCT